MTRVEVDHWLVRLQTGFNERNADALAELHAADGSFESPAHGLVHGRDAIRNIYKYWYTAFPDFTFSWGAPIIDPPRAAVFWQFEGTAAGPFFGEVKAGTRVRMKGAAEFTFGDAGILSVRHIFDFSGVLVAAGVLKIKPGS